MLRCFKYQAKTVALYIGGVLGVSIPVIFLYRFLAGNGAAGAYYLSGMATGVVAMICFAVCMTLMSYYNQMAISMSCTRKNFFIAEQISKLALALGLFVVIIIDYYLIGKLFEAFVAINIDITIILLSTCFITASLGECIGVVSARFGKIGMIIYMAICAVFGGVIGFTIVSGITIFSDIITFVISKSWITLCAALIFSTVITFVSAFFNRKSTGVV